MKANFIITGGGTGGHLAVATALAQAGGNCVYIGSSKGQDRSWFSNASNQTGVFKSYFLPSRGFVGLNKFRKLLALFMLAISSFMAIFILLRHRPRAVISVGGYAALPACAAAILLKIPVFLHEQNSRMGLANKIIARYAKAVFCAYVNTPQASTNARKELDELGFHKLCEPEPAHANNDTFSATYAPYPLRFAKSYKFRRELRTIGILGGSLGAASLNKLAIKLALKLKLNLLHQCGSGNFQDCLEAYEQAGIKVRAYEKLDDVRNLETDLKSPSNDHANVVLIGFCSDMSGLLDRLDFAISRSGASASAELLAAGVPTLFVPYKYAASNHQFYNALAASKQGLALLAERPNEHLIEQIIASKAPQIISAALEGAYAQDGAEFIIKSCDDILA